MRRIIALVTVAALMVVMTMFAAGAALAAPGSCIYFYNPVAGNFVVQKESPSGQIKLYATNHPPPSCTFGGLFPPQ